jgi:hypothetical protein
MVAPLFDFESIGELEVKGVQAPVKAFRVLAPKVRPGSLISAPLIMRRADGCTLVCYWIDRRTARSSVIGEAGLGKSRL